VKAPAGFSLLLFSELRMWATVWNWPSGGRSGYGR